jgi:hypothetical protein
VGRRCASQVCQQHTSVCSSGPPQPGLECRLLRCIGPQRCESCGAGLGWAGSCCLVRQRVVPAQAAGSCQSGRGRSLAGWCGSGWTAQRLECARHAWGRACPCKASCRLRLWCVCLAQPPHHLYPNPSPQPSLTCSSSYYCAAADEVLMRQFLLAVELTGSEFTEAVQYYSRVNVPPRCLATATARSSLLLTLQDRACGLGQGTVATVFGVSVRVVTCTSLSSCLFTCPALLRIGQRSLGCPPART